MAKEKDTPKKLKRLRRQLNSYGDQPSTRSGRFHYNGNGDVEPVEDNGTIVLTRKGRIEKAIQTITNKSKR